VRRLGLRSIVLALIAIGVSAAPAAETALDILRRRLDLETGARRWTDRHEVLTMRMLGPGRDEGRVFAIDSYEKRFADGRSATVAFLKAPPDVQGTAFLAIRDRTAPLQQWLYLPFAKAPRRVTRPAGEAFMGSDLTYGDVDLLRAIATWSENDVTATLAGKEEVDGVPTVVLALVPKQADIEYPRVIVWLGAGDLIARRIDLRTGEADTRKRVWQTDVRDAAGIPIPRKVTVETVAAGTRTEIAVTEVAVNEGLDDALFTQSALERGRP
jgi:hypothetical protein